MILFNLIVGANCYGVFLVIAECFYKKFQQVERESFTTMEWGCGPERGDLAETWFRFWEVRYGMIQ